MASTSDLHVPPAGFHRARPIAVSGIEQVVGRWTLAAITVAVVLAVVETVVPGEEVDAVWLSSAAAIILLARHLGFWTGLVLTLWTAAIIVLLVVRPAGGLPGATAEDIAALVLFVVVAVVGSRAVSSSRRSAAVPVAVGTSSELVEPLTEREREILGLLVSGMSNREIAGFLVVSPNTVKTHLEHLYGKLGVTSRLQASARARELGLLEPPA